MGLPDEYPPDLVLRTRFCEPDLARERWWSRATLRSSGHDEQIWPTPELPCRVNQTFFQPVLLHHTRSQPNVSLMLSCEVEQVEADDDAVRVVVNEGGRRSVLECSYLVGCDGAHSVVRKAIGATLEGIPELRKTVSVHFRSRDLERMNTRPAWSYAIYNADLGFGGMFALDGRDHWLCHTGFPVTETTDEVDPHTLIHQMVGAEIDVEIIQVIRWTARALVGGPVPRGPSPARRRRRASLGAGGRIRDELGNSGSDDARVDARGDVRGWGGDGLLDAYEQERRPLGEQVAAIVTEISRNSSGVKMRDTLRGVLPDVERSGPVGDRARESSPRLRAQALLSPALAARAQLRVSLRGLADHRRRRNPATALRVRDVQPGCAPGPPPTAFSARRRDTRVRLTRPRLLAVVRGRSAQITRRASSTRRTALAYR